MFNEHSFKHLFKSNSNDYKTIEEYMNFIQGHKSSANFNFDSLKKAFPFIVLNGNGENFNTVPKQEQETTPVLKSKRKAKKLKKLKRGKITKTSRKAANSRNTSFGLKEISNNVKRIVKGLKRTTYKEISDIIINEINESMTNCKDEKNIRRRIYDSLNVMKAMKLFKKDKNEKFILWNGDKAKDYYMNSNSQMTFNDLGTKVLLNNLSLEELGVQLVIYYLL
jgi:hypothetical protein